MGGGADVADIRTQIGQKGDSVLLGSVSLEALGFILDPIKRELRPLPMLLVRHQPR